MQRFKRTVITGSGSYIPAIIKENSQFATQDFYGENQEKIPGASEVIVRKLEQVTGISARRYASDKMNASEMATIAGTFALEEAGCNKETIDQLIVAHNFGDVIKHSIQSDAVPSLAARVKHAIGINNPDCVAYDILFGCPGWIQALIQADAFIKAGMAKKCMVIGTETLSRVIDQYDRDSMIFSDGAGAVIIEAKEVEEKGPGILSSIAQTHSREELNWICLGKSYFPESDEHTRFIKMQGRKVYEFALKVVPEAMKTCLLKANINITNLKKIFIHQANEKMDTAIVKAFYKLYDITEVPPCIMPMNIRELGNSSVATVPTLFDMVSKGQINDHSIAEGDVILFASVGAGMNINAICYRV